MKILGLPGLRPETEAWMQSLLSALQGPSIDYEIAKYRHWSGDEKPNVDHEASCCAKNPVECVIAKSMGTMVAIRAFDVFKCKPQRAIFIGTSLAPLRASKFGPLARFVDSVPTLFIQQTSDPTGPYEKLKETVQAYQNGTIVEVPGDDHAYSDIERLQAIIQPVLSGDG
jgi:hypothetical protein